MTTLAQLSASAFNQLDQYAGSPHHRTYCHSELAVSSLVVAKVIAGDHLPTHGGWPG